MVDIQMIKVRQKFPDAHITNIEEEVRKQIALSGITIKKGAKIAIAVGSRGIANIHRVVKSTVEWVKEMGGDPFVIPAMGSHGGANAQGQREVLEGYGITEDFIGASIKSSLQVVELPQGNLENKVYMDRLAYEADGTIIINRIKPHTDFHGPIESGLMKMCVIGLGKHKQALEIHSFGVRGLKELIVPTARQVLQHGNIIMGIAIVENAYDQTAIIEAIHPKQLEQREMALLKQAREFMPSLPVSKIDILIIDEMGKDISGVGMDTNIIGRMKIAGEKEPENPDIHTIVVMDLTQGSHGNALGMGLADITTDRLFKKIDFEATNANVVTSTFLERGKMPIVAPSDKMAVVYALRTCAGKNKDEICLIRIKNTLRLDQIYVSKAVWEEIKEKDNIEALDGWKPLFDGEHLNGN